MPSARRDMREALKHRGVVGDRPQIVETPGERAMPGARLVTLARITPDPGQPRKHFDPQTLDELAASIRERGVMQPLVVRPMGEGYTIVMGERRYRAALLVGLEEVPVVVRDIGDDQAYLDALIENLQREDLTDAEEAEAYRGLIARGLSVRRIADSLGITASKVSRMIRVYEDKTLSVAVIAGQITKSQAQEMLVATPEEKPQLVQFVTDRRERDEPLGLPELRREVAVRRRAGVVLHNTMTTEEDTGAMVVAQQSPAISGTQSFISLHDQSVAAGRLQARTLRQMIEAQLPVLISLAQDEEVSIELDRIRRVVLQIFDAAERRR